MQEQGFLFEQKITNKEEIIITGNINLKAKFRKFNFNEDEIKIIIFVFESKLNKDIAMDIIKSEKFVEKVLTGIYKKIGAKSKIDLVLKLLEIKVERK